MMCSTPYKMTADFTSRKGSDLENLVENICALLKELPIQSDIEKQAVLCSLLQALHLKHDSWYHTELSSTRTEKLTLTTVDEKVKQHAIRIAQHKQELVTDTTDGKIGGWIEELCIIQEQHEKFLVTELQRIVQERDLLVQSLYSSRSTREPESNSVEGIQACVDKLCKSVGASELQAHSSLLVEEVKELQRMNRLNVSDRIASIQEMKDQAIAKGRDLEREILRLTHELTVKDTEFKLIDKTRVKALQAQLLGLQKERDEMQKKNEKLEDTLDTLKLTHSLKCLLSKEEDLKVKHDKDLQNFKSEVEKLKSSLECVVAERNHVMEERNHLVLQLKDISAKLQQEYERAERLQRVVMALRQRTRGT